MIAPYRRKTLSLLLALASAQAGAQGLQTGPDFLRGGEYIIQVNKTDTNYDPNEVQRDFIWDYDTPTREGIVDARITVNADGSVGDVQLLGGFYEEDFREDALAGLATTTFKPAMAGDMPVAWPAFDIRVILRGPYQPGVSADMSADLEALVAQIAAKDFAAAETKANELLRDKARTLFDYAVLQDLLASIYMGTERGHHALAAMRNATQGSKAVVALSSADSRLGDRSDAFPDTYLSDALYISALQKRLLLAMALNQTGEALDVFAQIEARTEVAAGDPMRTQVDAVRAKLASEEPIASQIKLVNGVWSFDTSTRRIFGMTGLQEGAQVDYVDIACEDALRRRMPFTNDSEFAMPASWQNCKLEFHGADGAQFLLYEYLN